MKPGGGAVLLQTGGNVPALIDKEVPEIYMPRVQFFVRYLLVTVTLVYFNFSPIPPLLLSLKHINVIIIIYYAFHLLWWRYYRKNGSNVTLIRLGAWVDSAAAAIALICDPFIVPPTIGLLLIASLGNGIQHGFKIFVECMIGAFIFGTAALTFHYFFLERRPPYNIYLYVFLIGFAIYYAYLLVRRLEHMRMEAIRVSEHDALTGILNRRAFLRTAGYLLTLNERTNVPLVFVFADLDSFKAVNDRHGHVMGDKVLQIFPEIVKSQLRKNDIIARYGGDEFVMILTNTTPENAKSVLNRIEDEFREWAQHNGLPVGVSFGIGTALPGEHDIDNVLRRVDEDLYHVKEAKKARR